MITIGWRTIMFSSVILVIGRRWWASFSRDIRPPKIFLCYPCTWVSQGCSLNCFLSLFKVSATFKPPCAKNLIRICCVMEECTSCSHIVTLRRKKVVWTESTLDIPTYNVLKPCPTSSVMYPIKMTLFIIYHFFGDSVFINK